jgi:DNA-binding MarR family transcriptional regulator
VCTLGYVVETASKRGKGALASDVWERLVEFFVGRQRHLHSSGTVGLNPGVMKALLALEPGDPRPMGVLAQTFACDASNVTWLVDRLEEHGLVERQAHPTDRRVKTVALTPAGEKTRADLRAQMYEAPPELLALSREDLETLRAILAKLPR